MWPGNPNFTGPRIDLSWHPSLERVTRELSTWHKEESGGLVLAGGYGCAKTTLAKIILHAVGGPAIVMDWSSGRPESIRNALFYSEPALLDEIRLGYSSSGSSDERIIRLCQQARLFILDDLGAGHYSEDSQRWYEHICWRIFNERQGLKTLVTTNLTPPEVKSRLGGRAWSRLQEILGRPDRYIGMFDVPDYRAKEWVMEEEDSEPQGY